MSDELIKKPNTKPVNPEGEDKSFMDLLKDLVNEAINYNKQQSQLIKEYLEKKIHKGKYSFRFPFILKEEHIKSFQECVKQRLDEKYGENYELRFISSVEFKNNDKMIYKSIRELFEANHSETMLRIQLTWTYIINEEVNGITVPISYDIDIFYEIEQDSDQREMYKLEEWGATIVEGSENDWINETLKKLKNITNSTKMPFWWYYPKKAFLAVRDYTHVLIYAIVTIGTFLLSGRLTNSNQPNLEFVEKARQIFDASEKIQAYIEYTLISRNTTHIWIYFVLTAIPLVLTLALTKASRYVFPPSMILIGCTKTKMKNKLVAYNFIWAAIITAIIGLIVTCIIRL